MLAGHVPARETRLSVAVKMRLRAILSNARLLCDVERSLFARNQQVSDTPALLNNGLKASGCGTSPSGPRPPNFSFCSAFFSTAIKGRTSQKSNSNFSYIKRL
jgi:hypothetical protein